MANEEISRRDLERLESEIGPAPHIREVVSAHRCGVCKRVIPYKRLRRVYGGLRVGLDSLCDACWPDFEDKVPLVCINCGMVACRLEPHIQRKTGFKFKRGRVYHVRECASCTNKLDENNAVAVSILEVENYMRAYGKPITITT